MWHVVVLSKSRGYSISQHFSACVCACGYVRTVCVCLVGVFLYVRARFRACVCVCLCIYRCLLLCSVKHMNDSCHNMNELCQTHAALHCTRQLRLGGHVTRMNESCHTCEWVMSHIWMSDITQVVLFTATATSTWKARHTWMSYVTHVNESCHTWMSHFTKVQLLTAHGNFDSDVTTGAGARTSNNYHCHNFKQKFTCVPVSFKQIFMGVPRISNMLSRE